MRDEYDIENLNPRKNPYSNRVKKQITINIDGEIIDYFKEQSEISGISLMQIREEIFINNLIGKG